MQRYLTENEIVNILDFIQPNKKLPPESAMSIVKNNKDRFAKQLRKQKLYPKLIPELKKQLHLNYIKTSMEPGESVGIIAAMAIGEKQTQNSIVYDEEVLVKKDNKIMKRQIGEFIENEMTFGDPIDIGNDSYIMVPENLEVLTISQNEKIEWKHVTEISKHPTNGDLVKIKTESGRHVTSTLAHSHLRKAYSDDKKTFKILPVLGSELKITDRIPIIRKTPVVSDYITSIFISDYIKHDKVENGFIYLNDERMINKIVIDDITAWFFGIFSICGHYINDNKELSNYICIKNKKADKVFDDNMIKFIDKLNIIQISSSYYFEKQEPCYTREMIDKDGDSYFYHMIYSKVFRDFIMSIFTCNNIPAFMYNLNYKYTKLIIKLWLDNLRTTITRTNIFKQLQNYFTYLGIYSSARKNKDGVYSLKIQNKFKPYIESVYGDIQNLDIFEEDYEEGEDYLDTGDVIWEKIVSIELIKEKNYKYKNVYDFSVAGNETFALFSGIVVHNTLNTFHKA